MLCFLKRILPFTLTLIIGLAIGSFFNLFKAQTPVTIGVLRAESSYASGGGGCRTRRRAFSENYRSATIFNQVEPSYTNEARRNHTEGEVILRVVLGADGTVKDVETITSLPDGLTEQARKAARMITFTPATFNGQNVEEVRTITYYFNLN